MISELQRIFDRHHRNGIVRVEYETEIYWGEV